MVNIVKLKFAMTVEVSHELADELGKDIAHDLLCEMYNGEDTLDWEYIGYEVLM
jgi:hypothetical protein